MIVIDSAELEHWTPDFSSSGQQNPDWVRLRFRDHIICNALTWVDWSRNPVQVEVCEQCGVIHCASGGYVQVSRLGDLIVWTRPTPPRDDVWATTEYAESSAVRHLGAIAIPVAVWNQWRHETTLPEAADLPSMTGEELVMLWLSGIPRSLRCGSVEEVVPMLRRNLLAADTLDVDVVIQTLERVIDQMQTWTKRPLAGAITTAAVAHARVETLYCDGPKFVEWAAIAAIGDGFVPALSREWIAVLDPSH